MVRLPILSVFLTTLSLSVAHTIITYPGWRGDNLNHNGTYNVDDYTLFPYGMQWAYPCGGMKISNNRTYWGLDGGAIAVQSGWFSGHSTAFMHFNLGIGNVPENYSFIMQPTFQIVGPTNEEYPGQGICFPQVPLPANVTVKEGDNATIQVVENAKHGAALYNCVDITFTANHDLIAPINETNCVNDSSIQFGSVFSTASLTVSDAGLSLRSPPSVAVLTAVTAALIGVAAWGVL